MNPWVLALLGAGGGLFVGLVMAQIHWQAAQKNLRDNFDCVPRTWPEPEDPKLPWQGPEKRDL